MIATPTVDEPYRIETPEGVLITYATAGAASRSMAALIDYGLLFSIFLVVWMAVAVGTGSANSIFASDVILAFLFIFIFVMNWGYYIVFELIWNGQTPGKRLLRLRVLREGGRPVDGGAILVRNLMRAIDFLPVLYGLGLVAMFVDRRNRRLGDLAAGTIVVREGDPIRLADVAAPRQLTLPPRAPGAPPTPLLPNLERLTPAYLDLVVTFLQQRAKLDAAARAALAAELSALIHRCLELPLVDGDPEKFLEHLIREHAVAQAMMARQSG